MSGDTSQGRRQYAQGCGDLSRHLGNFRENIASLCATGPDQPYFLSSSAGNIFFFRDLYSSTWKMSQQCTQRPNGPSRRQELEEPRAAIRSLCGLAGTPGQWGSGPTRIQQPRALSLIYPKDIYRASTFNGSSPMPALPSLEFPHS